MKEVKISIRELVEFVFRRGNIDNRADSAINGVDGIRAHQKIQRSYGENGKAEVPLKLQLEFLNALIKIEGRADGILEEAEGYVIDEIKLMAGDVQAMSEDHNPLHWAQVMVYGYIFLTEKGLPEITLQLTYCSFEEETVRRFRRKYTSLELASFFTDLMDRYKEWLTLSFEWENKRDQSISLCEFPFPGYRPGQRELAVRVYKAIETGVNCFAQAPTGVGKTISTVFPAVKAMGMGLTSKIFYFTAKTITREAAEDSIRMLREKGLHLKSVTLTAKEKICPMEHTNCNPDYCPYAKGHYDRVNKAIRELLETSMVYDRDEILKAGEKHQVCPFELALDLTLWADMVVCDYNYLFDPRVYLKRFFEGRRTDFTFLIDEAHNLVDRARSMYSAELLKSELLDVKKSLDKKEKKLKDLLNKLHKVFLERQKALPEEDFQTSEEAPEELSSLLSRFMELGGEYLENRKTPELLKEANVEEKDLFLELYFKIYTFLSIWEFYDDKYLTIYQKTGKDMRIRLFCADPSRVIQERMKLGKANVLFSATLLPMDYFSEIFGAQEQDFRIQLGSPFKKENRLLMIGDRVETTYKKREFTVEALSEYIGECVLAKDGNYMVFLPSYVYMEQLYEVFSTHYPHIPSVMQGRNMSEEEKELFLERYRQETDGTTHVGFCVLGGHFSEGIDLAADRLIGVFVVGVGMPQLGAERDIIKGYFDRHGKDGFEQSYVFPGFIKVLQAAGRCIRTEQDKGIILLLDARYGQQRYQRLFPREWEDVLAVRSPVEAGLKAKSFWAEAETTVAPLEN